MVTLFDKLGTRFMWLRQWLVLLALAMPFLAEGCARPAEPPKTGARPEAVVIDFFSANRRSAACSGTLLTQNIVLTSAHCTGNATGARVFAPNAGGKTARVSRVLTYDWVHGDPANDPAVRNDIALLVLRDPIVLEKYPKIQREMCLGCSVAQIGRMDQSITSDVRMSGALRTSRKPPAGRLMDLYVRDGMDDSGGGVYRVINGHTRNLVGVTAGRGTRTGGGYVAQLSYADVQDWIRAIARAASRPSAGKTAPTSHPMDGEETTDPDPNAVDNTAGGEEVDPIAAPDPIETDSDNSGYGGDGGYGNESSYGGDAGYGNEGGYGNESGGGGDGGYGNESSYGGDAGYGNEGGYGNESGGGGDAGYGNESGYGGDAGYGNEGGYGNESGGGGDAGYGNEGGYGNESGGGDAGYGNESGDGGESAVGGESGVGGSADPNAEPPTPTEPEKVDDPPIDETTDLGPSLDTYMFPGPSGNIYSRDDDVTTTTNCDSGKPCSVTSLSSGFSLDTLAKPAAARNCQVINDGGAGCLTAHGNVGYIATDVISTNKDAAKKLYENSPTGEVVLQVCNAGAQRQVYCGNGNHCSIGNAAGNFAKDAGGDPAKTYGCTGKVYPNQGGWCDGEWVTGKGDPVSPETKQKLGLGDCKAGVLQYFTPTCYK